MDFTVKPI